jgi:hypothetical protein
VCGKSNAAVQVMIKGDAFGDDFALCDECVDKAARLVAMKKAAQNE